jgi:tetratricopeptide (TPR) repeat protein
MKIPTGIEKVSLSKSDVPLGPYPSLGFVPLWDAELGNGDYFGLYWPLGKENEEPIVCDMLHDEWALEPRFSSLEKFIEWLELNDWERGDEEIVDDQLSTAIFNKAKTLYSSSDIEAAINLLNKACINFPEVSEYWFALSSQSKRVGDMEKSANAALKALNSNWVFGFPAQGVIRSLRSSQFREALSKDPIVQRIDEFELNFGGVKENSIYPIIYECVQEYLNSERFIDGLMLYQNYGYMMCSETGAFQERYNFDLKSWRSEYSELCLKHLGDNRVFSS